MENDSLYLPPEIIRDILVRLTVKSLVRFQCVCKDWKNLFRTSSFIADHLHRSTQQNRLLAVDSIISGTQRWQLCLLNPEMQVLELKDRRIFNYWCSRIVYSSNGLLCVEIAPRSQHSFWLWNPSIRKSIQVLKPFDSGKYSAAGFGFSPIVNDYKIVKLSMSVGLVDQAEVYSLRTGLWRTVEHGDLEGVFVYNPPGVTCNGAIFWFGTKEGQDEEVIVSFDIAMEVFTLIPIPPAICSPMATLTTYENKLAMLVPTMFEDPESIYLWVLEESTDPSKERWSWTKLYTSKPNPSRFRISPRIIWRNEIVCSVKSSERKTQVVFCNITTDEFKVFAIPKHGKNPQIYDYVESLALLDKIQV